MTYWVSIRLLHKIVRYGSKPLGCTMSFKVRIKLSACYFLLIILISIMNSKNDKRVENNCRKKMILGERNAPKPTSRKLVWVINMEGSTFIPVNKPEEFEGDPEVMNTMMHKTLPEINKSMGKIWIK